MSAPVRTWAMFWKGFGPHLLPFAEAASETLPLARLLRLSLFQVAVGMAAVLLTGTLNRVMIVELGVSATLVAVMVSLPFLIAPFRALIGFKSDTHRSLLGWRRVPYIWFGTILQFGGLAIMPFALLLLQSQSMGPEWIGPAAAALAFLMTGIGIHTVQTAGLALATDLSAPQDRPQAVALMYVMLLVGMLVSAVVFSFLLEGFTPKRLIQVIQGAAVVTMVFNLVALWKQEARQPHLTSPALARPRFGEAFARFRADRRSTRLLVALGLGTIGFSMQDVLLEPYGAEVLGLSVSQTTLLTALLAGGTLAGFAVSGALLARGSDPRRLAALGMLVGIGAFSCVILAAPLASATLFRSGTLLIGLGGGLFAVSTLIACMDLAEDGTAGLALGAWGAVQASAVGIGLAAGGILRDASGGLLESLSTAGAPINPALGYCVVYHLEIGFLFASLVAIGPIIRFADPTVPQSRERIGLADLPT